MKTIKRKDGTKINLNLDGNVWFITEKTGGPCLGNITNKICTVYGNGVGLDAKTQNKYYSIHKILFKYGEQLHIRKIRIEVVTKKKTDLGDRTIIRYAYIPRDKFKYLLKNRKEVPIGLGNVHKMILVKHSDVELKRV